MLEKKKETEIIFFARCRNRFQRTRLLRMVTVLNYEYNGVIIHEERITIQFAENSLHSFTHVGRLVF